MFSTQLIYHLYLNVMQLTAIMPGPRQKRENLENILPPRIFCACCFEFYFPLFFILFNLLVHRYMTMMMVVIPCMCYADDDDDTHLCDLPKIIMAVVVAVLRFCCCFIYFLIHFTYVVRRTIITTDCCRLTPAAYIWYVMPNEAFKKH